MKKIKIFCILLVFTIGSFTLFGGGASEQSKKTTMNILSHPVHKKVTEDSTTAKSLLDQWISSHDDVESVEWDTYDIDPLRDRLFRETSLPQTSVDVAYALNKFMVPRITSLFEPLDEYLKSSPIAGFPEDYSPSMLEALTFDGKLYGIPIRPSTATLHWNQKLFDEANLPGPPKTAEEFMEYAKKLTYERKDGSKVYGFTIAGGANMVNEVAQFIAMWDGAFIDTNYKIVCNSPETIKALEMLQELYQKGYMPAISLTQPHTEFQRLIQSGTVGMTIAIPGNTVTYNDPAGSQTPGAWKVATVPISTSISGYEVAPVPAEFWALVIPKNASNKDLSWELVSFLSSYQSTLNMALNGNTPARLSVLDDQEFSEGVSWAKEYQAHMKYSAVPLPAFDEVAEAQEMMTVALQRVIKGEVSAVNGMEKLRTDLLKLSKTLK